MRKLRLRQRTTSQEVGVGKVGPLLPTCPIQIPTAVILLSVSAFQQNAFIQQPPHPPPPPGCSVLNGGYNLMGRPQAQGQKARARRPATHKPSWWHRETQRGRTSWDGERRAQKTSVVFWGPERKGRGRVMTGVTPNTTMQGAKGEGGGARV